MSARHRLFIVMIMSALLALAPAAYAQVTTGTLTGVVIIQGDGMALPGATIEATHVPTGTRYSTATRDNGRYVIPNVRVGGPYRLRATLQGFRPEQLGAIEVALGTATEVPELAMRPEVTETIVVTATADDIINPNRTGSTSSVSTQQIESLPTVNRSLQDFARTNPYVAVDGGDASATRITVAGKNNRYNSIQIDGAVNNDLFGLAASGTPGGGADVQPISIDAIKQIQIVISPYDVRQSGFTGGGVNAVTRSGSNDFAGSLFYSKRDAQFVGEGPFGNKVDKFDSEQYGGRFGGPIMHDRLFFFVTGEQNSRQEPNGVSAEAGSTSVTAEIASLAAQARQIAMTKYGYDPGPLGDFPEEKTGDNLFLRFDVNAGSRNQLTLRHNYVKGDLDVVSDRFNTRFRFPSSIYTFSSETNSTVAQLNSTFSTASFNEARVGLQTIRELRAVPVAFPSIDIGGAPRSAQIILGTERFSGANALDQDILEITDDFTWIAGNHTVTVGTHNELFDFKNLFQADAFGYYFFPTIADFEAGKPRDYSVTIATGADPRRPTKFDVAQYGFYASDLWRLNSSVTLTAGLRGDLPRFGKVPSNNPIVTDAIGFRTNEIPSEEIVWSPRFGFNWQPGASGTQQVRGGIGVFAGRTPYVWISNNYANTGIEQLTLTCNKPACTPQFVTDPLAQPTSFPAGGGAFLVNLIDPDFKLPHVLRTTLGYDRDLFFGIRASAEVVFTKNLEDVYYLNVNKRESGTSPLDGRPRYTSVSTKLSNAILLTNTDKGEQRMASIQLNKSFGRNFTLSASYANQDAKSAFDGGSSQALSNWQFHHTRGNIFKPEVSRSAFETEHRINLAGSWSFNTGPLGHTLGLYYNGQSGRPYSLLFQTDINGDGFATNDLLFVPGASGVIIQKNAGSTWTLEPGAQWIAYLERAGINPTAGRILDRYELTEPWVRQLDFHYELGLPAYRTVRTGITFDVLNLLNMFDSDSGVVRFVSNQNFLPVTFQGLDTATGKPIYRERAANTLRVGSQFTTADVRSRWQGRLGLRVTF